VTGANLLVLDVSADAVLLVTFGVGLEGRKMIRKSRER
jgi:hypothetical protein